MKVRFICAKLARSFLAVKFIEHVGEIGVSYYNFFIGIFF